MEMQRRSSLESKAEKETDLQSFETFQSFEHFVLNVLQTVAGKQHLIDTRCSFKCSFFNICNLVIA